MNDIQWRILSGKSRYPEHLPLLSRAAAIFRVSVYGFNVTHLNMRLLFTKFYTLVIHLQNCLNAPFTHRVIGLKHAECRWSNNGFRIYSNIIL
jgi:hypothetical protein